MEWALSFLLLKQLIKPTISPFAQNLASSDYVFEKVDNEINWT